MATDLLEPAQERPQELTPLALLQSAIDKGMDADQLEKLLALQERWTAARAAEAYAVAMNSCQSEMPTVVRDAKNTQTGSTYALLESVQFVAKPIYVKHGFSLSFGEADCPLPNHKRTVCDVRHGGGHKERYHVDLPVDGIGPKGNPIGGMNAVQGAVSTLSYGQRVLLCRIFNVTVAGEDKDGAGAPLTDEQTLAINDLFDECDKAGKPVDFKRFMAWLGVESLNDVGQKDFPKIMAELKRKAGRK